MKNVPVGCAPKFAGCRKGEKVMGFRNSRKVICADVQVIARLFLRCGKGEATSGREQMAGAYQRDCTGL